MGAPIGNQNGKKAKRWSNAVERAMDSFPNKPPSLEINKGIDEAAWSFVSQMMVEKDLGFFKEFGDRVEGKPAQSLTVGGDPENPLEHVHKIGLVNL